MVNIVSSSGHTGYNIKEFVCDSEQDVNNLPVDVAPGSQAIVLEENNLKVYLLNGQGDWIKI